LRQVTNGVMDRLSGCRSQCGIIDDHISCTTQRRWDMTTATNEYLGTDTENLLDYKAKVSADLLHLPGPDFIDRTWKNSDRSPQVLRNLAALYGNGRLGGTGYLSILPVDQGIEHSGGASFTPNPLYFDPSNIIELAIEGGCNAVASTFGVLGTVARTLPIFKASGFRLAINPA